DNEEMNRRMPMRILTSPLLALLLLSTAFAVHAQKFNPDARELSRECLSGDCIEGYGSLEITTNIGVNTYRGNFRNGMYHGFGKLTEMVSRTERAYYE